MERFDLIVLGGGPAGYLAAERATAGGLNTALFEKRALGGVCLNEGCIPTKTLLHSAKLYDHALHGKAYGVTAENVAINHAAVVERKEKVVKTLVSGVRGKMKACGVTVIEASAAVKGKTGGGFIVEADGAEYEADRLLIATGSQPVVPPIPGVKEGMEAGFVVTNREILDLKSIPQRLTVIGGGVIGLEMASYFSTAGSRVTVIEMLDKIAGPTDHEISLLLKKEMEKKGVEFRLGCRVTGIAAPRVEYEMGGETGSVEADMVLLSIGRSPVTSGLGLETIGIYTERGAVVTDGNLRTNVPNVYAAGDVNGKSMLAHTGYREAEVAVNHMLDRRDHMRYDAVPSVIYTVPEVASVGETEQSAGEKGLAFKAVKISMRHSGRFVTENDGGDGLCKLLVEQGSNRLLGVHLIGGYASEIIYGAAMMIESRWPIEDLRELVFPHPTVSEIIREALFAY